MVTSTCMVFTSLMLHPFHHPLAIAPRLLRLCCAPLARSRNSLFSDARSTAVRRKSVFLTQSLRQFKTADLFKVVQIQKSSFQSFQRCSESQISVHPCFWLGRRHSFATLRCLQSLAFVSQILRETLPRSFIIKGFFPKNHARALTVVFWQRASNSCKRPSTKIRAVSDMPIRINRCHGLPIPPSAVGKRSVPMPINYVL